jgi:pyrimidine-nucleoside phosphorylase
MTIASFITTKRDAGKHSPADVEWFIQNVIDGKISDEQVAAWLMAAYINGLDESEMIALTKAMAASGDQIQLDEITKPILDKHSTGGVGDATTLIVLPLLAAAGVNVVKMSGRSLGHTGGTLDKLESIPGFKIDLTKKQLVEQAKQIGCALGGQTASIAPADKILYAIRDSTETIASIPLIAASIMSKKIAAGADAFVFDVKTGNGAFMPSPSQSRELANVLVNISKRVGKKARAIVSDMNQPLANAIGNSLEVCAAVQELHAQCKNRLGQLSIALANEALELAGKEPRAQQIAESDKAIEKFKQWVQAQGGDPNVADAPRKVLPQAPLVQKILSESEGWVAKMQTREMGEIVRSLGGGRTRKEDSVNPAVGLLVHVEIGQKVRTGDPIFEIHANTEEDAQIAAESCAKAITLANQPIDPPPLIYERIT